MNIGRNKNFTLRLLFCCRPGSQRSYLLKSIPAFIILLVLIISLALVSGGCTRVAEVKLYFAKYEDNSMYLVPELRKIKKDDNFYKTVLEELISGPKSEQLYPVLPSMVKVNSVKLEEDLAIADFSKEIITDISEIPHSSATEILAIFSIVDTLTEFDEITKVRITVEGKRQGEIEGLYIEDFWGHVGIYEDFERNEDMLIKN